MTHPDFRRKLEAIGFGFFIPVFFVTSGVRFDLDALTAIDVEPGRWSRSSSPRCSLVRGAARRCSTGACWTAAARASPALMQATSLPFIVAATAIGLELGLIDAAESAALIGAGLLSVLIFPLARADPAALRRRRAPSRTATGRRSPVTPRRLERTTRRPYRGGTRWRTTVGTAAARTEGLRGLKGKNVLVTGGSSGIGQAIAVRFAEYGANVAINYLRQPEEAHDTEEQVHACVHKVQPGGRPDVLVGGDVSKEDDVVRMVGEAVEGLGGIDVLVNNAGIQISRPVATSSRSADFDKVLAVNLRGSFLCAREAIKHFLADGQAAARSSTSRASTSSSRSPTTSATRSSKGGMQNLTRTLALEYAGRGIRVNGDRPGRDGHADQPRLDRRPGQARRRSRSTSRCARAGDADEMAGVTCFLASDDAAYITGQTIFVDGGLTLFPSFREPWSSE